jgi:ABC-2 type transport system permease protein
MVRRENWEHRAIWTTPLIVIACWTLLLMFAPVHLPYEIGAPISDLPREAQITLHQFAYLLAVVILFFVMGVIAFFYAIDSLYADRNDRSVLFWKSLPLSDAETVLSKFAMGAVVIPLVALLGSVLAQFVAGAVITARLAITGEPVGFWLHPEALAGGALMAIIACVSVILWYAPLVAYLMLASAWAPRGPFLWAVLPPAAACVLERFVMRTSYLWDFITDRLLGVLALFHGLGDGEDEPESLAQLADRLADADVARSLREFYASPELWIGLVVAALLLGAAMWVRRYRDETS